MDVIRKTMGPAAILVGAFWVGGLAFAGGPSSACGGEEPRSLSKMQC